MALAKVISCNGRDKNHISVWELKKQRQDRKIFTDMQNKGYELG